jgi:hypothetical protein
VEKILQLVLMQEQNIGMVQVGQKLNDMATARDMQVEEATASASYLAFGGTPVH